jgi:hypothetical protein
MMAVATGYSAGEGPTGFLPFVTLRVPDFQAVYDASAAKAHAQALADLGPRVRGTTVEEEAAE